MRECRECAAKRARTPFERGLKHALVHLAFKLVPEGLTGLLGFFEAQKLFHAKSCWLVLIWFANLRHL